MAYTTPVPTKSPGDTWTAAEHNTYIRDNFAASVPDVFTAAGQLVVGTGADAMTTLNIVSTSGWVLTATSVSPKMKWALDSVKDIVTTKGDLLAATGADTLVRLPVGANDQVLVGDSTKSTGVKWATVAPAMAYARFKVNASQSIANNTSVAIIQFHSSDYDTDSAVTTGAAWKMTVNSTNPGYYLVTAKVSARSTSVWEASEQASLRLYKNGALSAVLGTQYMHAAGTYPVSVGGATVISLAAADYIDCRLYQNSDFPLALQSTGTMTHFAAARIF